MTWCFLDTETTGLGPDDEIWEFAGRRYGDGDIQELHLFIEHDVRKAQYLPTPFYKDYTTRYPGAWKSVTSASAASLKIQEFTLGAHIIGANPAFDAEKLAVMLRKYNLEPKWHYHLLDVENLILGYLLGRGEKVATPWKSEELSRRVGVDPADFQRHTAMGDVLWVEAQWAAVMPGPDD